MVAETPQVLISQKMMRKMTTKVMEYFHLLTVKIDTNVIVFTYTMHKYTFAIDAIIKYPQACEHMYTRHAHTQTRTQIRTHAHTNTRTITRTHTRTKTRAYAQAPPTCTHKHARMHAYVHTNMRTRTRIAFLI